MQTSTLVMPQPRLRSWEIAGAVIGCILAPVLHFTFEWSGRAYIVGLFSAVNESVWEHTKLVYFPFLLFAMVEYIVLRPHFRRFFVAKALSLAFMSVALIAFFYTYSGILGFELLWLDVLSTFVWVALGYLFSYRLYRCTWRIEKLFVPVGILFLGQLAAQILFTPFPPNLPLFQAGESGVLGFDMQTEIFYAG